MGSKVSMLSFFVAIRTSVFANLIIIGELTALSLIFIRLEFSHPAAGGGDVVELFEGVGLVHEAGYLLGDAVCLPVV